MDISILPPCAPSTCLRVASVEPYAGEPLHKAERRAVRRLLGTMLGIEGEVSYSYLPSGAPYLPTHPELYLSLSHTKTHVAVALEHHHPIGLDIERHGTRVERVVPRYLLPEEQAALSDHPHRLRDLHLLWSAKEAAYKLVHPASESLLSFRARLPLPTEVSGTFYLDYLDDPSSSPVSIAYCVAQAYSLCLASLPQGAMSHVPLDGGSSGGFAEE